MDRVYSKRASFLVLCFDRYDFLTSASLGPPLGGELSSSFSATGDNSPSRRAGGGEAESGEGGRLGLRTGSAGGADGGGDSGDGGSFLAYESLNETRRSLSAMAPPSPDVLRRSLTAPSLDQRREGRLDTGGEGMPLQGRNTGGEGMPLQGRNTGGEGLPLQGRNTDGEGRLPVEASRQASLSSQGSFEISRQSSRSISRQNSPIARQRNLAASVELSRQNGNSHGNSLARQGSVEVSRQANLSASLGLPRQGSVEVSRQPSLSSSMEFDSVAASPHKSVGSRGSRFSQSRRSLPAGACQRETGLSLYIYTYIHAYTCIHIYLNIYIHIYLYIYVYTYIYIYIYMYIYICICVKKFIYTCADLSCLCGIANEGVSSHHSLTVQKWVIRN